MAPVTPPPPFNEAATILAQTFIAPLMVFVLGGVLGFISAYFLQSEVLKVRETIALTITMSWVVSLMADIAIQHYQTTIYVHGMMGGVVGYLFGVESFPFVATDKPAIRTNETEPVDHNARETECDPDTDDRTVDEMPHDPGSQN